MDGPRGVSLAIGAAAFRGLRNIERCEACQKMNEVVLSLEAFSTSLDEHINLQE